MTVLDAGRIGVAAQAVGVAQAAYDAAVEYSRDRKAFGAPIGSFQAIQGKIADMKNSVKDRTNAQTSCAGQFIANHLDRGWNKADPDASGEEETEGRIRRRWLHVDMAGPATNKDGRGTGYGVALLVHLISGELYADGK